MLEIGIIFTGFLVGTLVGLTGMGGGLLMTPLLILLYGFSPTMAVGTDLVYSAVTKAVGTLQHIRQRTWNKQIVFQLMKGSVPGGIIGVLAIRVLDHFSLSVEDVLGHLLGITFILVALLMGWRLIQKRRQNRTFRSLWQMPLGVLGLVGGFLVGLTSVGSGSMFMAFLLATTALPSPVMVGTDVVHAFFLTLTTGVVHASFGHVDWPFVMYLLIGSIPGILIGGRFTLKLPDFALRIGLIVVLFLTGVKLV
ncbi:sulfite exporter TauE/SafE family protein [Polycladomyces subterraneus]|uniref:Probable membrane transporter protein n=1 Tax=Polycladomyces subterraneus TaxID=1016997 RepID=A0ABT8ILU1_9BACL|nr:sulfite exporter TauE/SafE family protein [Polycladomyces subterraneus]MDN4593750.1 sulfite exporter TauE/SafE family protein [Polycladomyces subterraneus]